jgi:predicted nucleic acid-binding protein
MVLDTSILIDHERDVSAATEYVSNLVEHRAAAVHPVTRAELLFGARSRSHLAAVQAMLSAFRVLTIKNIDFVAATALLEKHVLSHRIGWPDCLIAATCLRLGLPVVTVNDRDFRVVKGLKVVRPY